LPSSKCTCSNASLAFALSAGEIDLEK
jgi:hypothetical protein